MVKRKETNSLRDNYLFDKFYVINWEIKLEIDAERDAAHVWMGGWVSGTGWGGGCKERWPASEQPCIERL